MGEGRDALKSTRIVQEGKSPHCHGPKDHESKYS